MWERPEGGRDQDYGVTISTRTWASLHASLERIAKSPSEHTHISYKPKQSLVPIVCDTCFGFIYLFVFIKSSLILAYIFGSRLYWIPDTNVNLFRKIIYLESKLEILAFQRFSMRRIACHYLSLFLFLSIFPPLTWDQTFVASTISWPLFCISIILFLFCYCCDGVCHQLA